MKTAWELRALTAPEGICDASAASVGVLVFLKAPGAFALVRRLQLPQMAAVVVFY